MIFDFEQVVKTKDEVTVIDHKNVKHTKKVVVNDNKEVDDYSFEGAKDLDNGKLNRKIEVKKENENVL